MTEPVLFVVIGMCKLGESSLCVIQTKNPRVSLSYTLGEPIPAGAAVFDSKEAAQKVADSHQGVRTADCPWDHFVWPVGVAERQAA